MTKETKIGLLVGLTFIILFAIILSEKGAENVAPSNLTVADANLAGETEITNPRQPLEGDGNFPNPLARGPIETAPVPSASHAVLLEQPVGREIPKSADDIPALPDSVIKRLNMEQMPERHVSASEMGPLPDDGMISLVDAVELAVKSPPESSNLEIQSDPEEEILVANRTNPSDDVLHATPSRNLNAKPRIIATHKVESGESLGKIAAKYYGRSTPSRVDAIFDVNRDTLASIHTVKVGDVLRIPDLDATGGVAFVDASSSNIANVINSMTRPTPTNEIRIPVPKSTPEVKTPVDVRPSEPRKRSEAADFVWYQVRENDTLSRIAKREMGSARYFLKLYEVNRDLLPDKNTIKPGIKIRIPVSSEEQISKKKATNTVDSSAVIFSNEPAD